MLIPNYNNDNVDTDTYTIPAEITDTEAMIYEFVLENYGDDEATNPSWNITALANYIDEMKAKGEDYRPRYTVAYEE